MKLIINGQEQTGPVSETHLGPLVERLQQEQQALGLHLLHIQLDNAKQTGWSPNLADKPLTGFQRIELQFAPMEALIQRNLDNARDYLDRLLPGIEKASQLFRTGNQQEANQFFLQIIDGIDWFSQVVDSVVQAKNLSPNQLRLGEQTYQDRKNTLLDLTTQMAEANKNRDWVLLADLLEYELQPFYEQWQEQISHLERPAGPASDLTH